MPFTKGHPQYNTGKTHFKKGHVAWNTGKKTGIVPSTAFKKGAKPWNTGLKGIHQSPDTEFKAGHTPHNWKGDLVGYDALHDWVRSKLGSADRCARGDDHKPPFEWSNISYEYKRDLDDWESLCHKCHLQKDKESNWGVISKIFPNNRKR